MKKSWYRDKNNGKLGGVCAGLSGMFSVDVTLIRLVWFALIFTPFPAILSYLIAWLIVPKKKS